MLLFGAKVEDVKGDMITVGELDDYIQQTMDDKKNEKSDDEEDIENEMKIFQILSIFLILF